MFLAIEAGLVVVALVLAFTVPDLGSRWCAALEYPYAGVLTWCSAAPTNKERAAICARLNRKPEGQLVIVKQDGSGKNTSFNWVYNRADLESAKIIWADDMGPAKNQELIRYFKHRQVWLLDVDDHPPKLMPYPNAGGGERGARRQSGPLGS
jgi:hypothetical protein